MLRNLFLLGAFTTVASAAVASPLNYAFRSVPVRAAIVLLDSQQSAGFQANEAPYTFYNLDSNRNIKPGGWTFYNPTAPSKVTPQIANRWNTIRVGTGALTVGDIISKKTGAYWELQLSQAGEAQMANYDLLLVPCYRNISLNANEREKLRRFVEAGGVLWIDVATGTPGFNIDFLNGFPLPFNVSAAPSGLADSYDFLHPLFNRPSVITTSDIRNMDSEQVLSFRNIQLAAMGLGDLEKFEASLEYDSSQFKSVAEDNIGTKIAVAQIGEGFIVATCRGVSRSLNQTVSAGGFQLNRDVHGERPTFARSSDAAGKLVINMVYLTASYSQIGRGSRKSNASILDLGAPMLKRWNADVALTPGAFNYIPPAVSKGRLFAVSNNNLYCFDANPSNDLNNDGDPDDGVRDYSVGSNVDLVWQQPIAGPSSGPTCAEVPNSATVDQVSLVDSNGILRVFNAVNGTAVAAIAPPTAAEVETGLPGRGPYSATYHDGFYFISDQVIAGLSSVGRVWIASAVTLSALQSGGNPWLCGGTSSPIMGKPTASPTVGYIPINDGSGGLDRVIYVPTRPTNTGGPNSAAAIHSLWLGAKGEKPFSVTPNGGQLFIVTRASLQGLNVYLPNNNDPLGFRLTVLDTNGNPVDAATLDTWFQPAVTQTGGLVTLTFEIGQSLPAGYTVRVDYTIDWSSTQPGYGAQILRGQLYLPDDTQKRRRVLGNIALAPDGIVHVVHSDPDPANNRGGAYYAFQEQRRGEFKMVTRYELYREHTFNLNQVGSTTYRETLSDVDPLVGLVPILGGRFGSLRFIGPPTVHNNIVYIPAGAIKGFGIPMTIMMAFRANPPAPEVVVGDIQGSFTIMQPDLARSDNKAAPALFSVFAGSNFTYEKDSAASKGVIRIENLMNIPRGFVGNSINLSQPIIIRRNGQPDLMVEPNRTGDRWSPLLWYTVFHGMDGDDGAGPALVTGDTVYFAGNSAAPYFFTLVGPPTLPPPTTGLLTAMAADISPNDPFLSPDLIRPWQKQMVMLKTNPTFASNPNIRWPQFAGLTSFQDYQVRLLQTTLNRTGGASATAYGIVGGDNVLASWSADGFFAFTKSDYIICDEGRLARFDASGNPVWTADAAIKSSIDTNVGTSAETKPLVRATKAYVINSRDMLVVDTGANRVVRLDIGGREIRSIDGFKIDPSFRPDGYTDGDALKLKEPRDALIFTTYESNPAQVSNPRPNEFWIHYIIADSGNKRIVELVDRYEMDNNGRVLGLVQYVENLQTTTASGVLYWHSPSSLSQKSFDYNSIARVFIEDPMNPGTGRYVYSAGIGSAMPTRVDLGLDTPSTTNPRESMGGNGGIVVFDGGNTQVINEVSVPQIAANVFYDPGTTSFTSAMVETRMKRLGNLTSVTMRNVVDATFGNRVAIMFTDSDGAWEIIQPAVNGPWVVRWFLPREAYRYIRRNGVLIFGSNPKDYRPTYAKRLDSGEVLIVNGYVGRTLANAEFTGEVLTIDGDVDPTNNNGIAGFGFGKTNLGFNSISVKAEIPPVQGARGIVAPVFADRR